MGILSKLVLFPIKAPVGGTLWIADKISEAAEAQRNDRGTLMVALREAERQLEAGDLSEAEYDEIEADLLTRLQAAP